MHKERCDSFGCFDADSTDFDRCEQKSRFLGVFFEELRNNRLSSLCFQDRNEAVDARSIFETNAGEIWNFQESFDIGG
jgi:hypothetical protein